MVNFKDSLRELKTILDCQGIRAAVIFLNGLTSHRFTSLYRFDENILHNLCFFDLDNPTQELIADIPVMASYCVFVRSSRGTFITPDSFQDDRVRNHPKWQEVRSYCGVPLLDEYGKMFGTICHFDFRPIPISDTNVALMEAIAPLIRKIV